jgi:hypothetical protein
MKWLFRRVIKQFLFYLSTIETLYDMGAKIGWGFMGKNLLENKENS